VQIQAIFEQAHLDCTRWLNQVIGELKDQISVHKSALDQRAESLMESHNNADKVIKNITNAEKDLIKFQEQSNQLDATLLKLMRSVKFNTDLSADGKVVQLNMGTANLTGSSNQKPTTKFDAPFI